MPKPPITRFANVTTAPSPTNNYETINITQLTQEQINAIQDPYLIEGGIVYNLTTKHLQAYEDGAWQTLDNNGDVVGPNASVATNIATFADTTGKVIQDSGISSNNIVQGPANSTQYGVPVFADTTGKLLASTTMIIRGVAAPLINTFASDQLIKIPLTTVNEISNLNNIQFVNGFGLILVDSLMPVEFLSNNYSGSNYQICSLFTGGLPSSSTTPSALVELQTTTGALLLSRLTNTQIGALTGPVGGMVLYNSTSNQFNAYIGSGSPYWGNIFISDSSGNLNMQSHYINNVLNPINPQDAATKNYVDTNIAAGTITLIGDVTGSGFLNTSIATTLANTIVTPGTYTYASFTVNSQGRLTAASSGTAPVTSITAGTGITVTGTTTPTISITNTAVTAGSYTYGSFTVNAQGQLTSASNGATPLLVSNNLSDLANAATARTNLGLTNIATQTVTQYSVLVGGSSNSITSIGLTNGQLLIGSTGTNPVAAVPTNGTNISWTTGAGSLTANLTGQVALANGGTNASLTASNGGIFYSTATAGAILAGTSTANQMLLSGSSGAPSWSTTTHPTTTTINQLLYSSANNVISGLATANNGVLITSSGGVPSISSTLPSTVQGNITSVGIIATGTWNGAVITVPYGGTGVISTTPYSLLCGGTTSTGALQSVASVGTSGQVLTSQGASALPTWTTPNIGSVTSITAGTNLTGGTITTSGTIALSPTPSGLTSIGVGNLSLSGGTISSSGTITITGTGTTFLNSAVGFPNSTWMYGQASSNGRSWYISSSDMYHELGGNGSFHWRNSSDSDIATLDYLGNLTIKGGQLYLGSTSTQNIFVDNPYTGGQMIFGYNTPRSSGQTSVLQVYNNSSARNLLFQVQSAGSSSGADGITLGCPIYLPTSGGSSTALNYYEEYSLAGSSASWVSNSGHGSSFNGGTIAVVRIGKAVIFMLKSPLTFNLSASDWVYTYLLPSRFQPAQTMVSNNVSVSISAVTSIGTFLYNTAGYIGLFFTNGASFATGSWTIQPFSVSWTVQ